MNRMGSVFSAYLAASIVYIVKTARNETLSPGEAFALLAAFIVIYYSSITTLSQIMSQRTQSHFQQNRIHPQSSRKLEFRVEELPLTDQIGRRCFGNCREAIISWHPIDQDKPLNRSNLREGGG